MSVQSKPFYWLVCDHDGCGVKSTEGGEFDAWSDVDGAEEDAYNSDWGRVGERDYCLEHYPLHDPDLKEES